MVCPANVSDKKFKNCINLILITYENKSHYVYIKYFNRLVCNKTKDKNKKHFCWYCLQFFRGEKVLKEHIKVCLKKNGQQIL